MEEVFGTRGERTFLELFSRCPAIPRSFLAPHFSFEPTPVVLTLARVPWLLQHGAGAVFLISLLALHSVGSLSSSSPELSPRFLLLEFACVRLPWWIGRDTSFLQCLSSVFLQSAISLLGDSLPFFYRSSTPRALGLSLCDLRNLGSFLVVVFNTFWDSCSPLLDFYENSNFSRHRFVEGSCTRGGFPPR